MEDHSVKAHTAPAFLEKLYDILEDPNLDEYIGWQPDGKSFLIKKVNELCELVLPRWFKHNNLQSFIRQLNMYSFSKTRHDSNYREFHQPMFQRGRRDLLPLIKRKVQATAAVTPASVSIGLTSQGAAGTTPLRAGVNNSPKMGSSSSGSLSPSPPLPPPAALVGHSFVDVMEQDDGVASLLKLGDYSELDSSQAQSTADQCVTAKDESAELGISEAAYLGATANGGANGIHSNGIQRGRSSDNVTIPNSEYQALLGRISYLESKVLDLGTVCTELTLKHNYLCTAIEKLLPSVVNPQVFEGNDQKPSTATPANIVELSNGSDAQKILASKETGLNEPNETTASKKTQPATEIEGIESSNDLMSQVITKYQEADNWKRYRSYSLCSNSTGEFVTKSINSVDEFDSDVDSDVGYASTSSYESLTSVSSVSSMGRKRNRDAVILDVIGQHSATVDGLNVSGNSAEKSGSHYSSHGKHKEDRNGFDKPRRRSKKKIRTKSSVPRAVPSIYDVLQILSDCRVQDCFSNGGMSEVGSSPNRSQSPKSPKASSTMILYNKTAPITLSDRVTTSNNAVVTPKSEANVGSSMAVSNTPPAGFDGLDAISAAIDIRNLHS